MPSELSNPRGSGVVLAATREAADSPPTEGLERAYRALYPRLVSFARSLGTGQEAEDVVHDALLKYWRHLEREPSEAASEVEPVLVAMVFEVARDRTRREGRRLALAQWITGPRAAVRRWMSPARQAADGEILNEIDRALAKLPRRWRDVWLLAYDDQLTFDSIGRLLGISASTARANYARACSRLRLELARVGLEPRDLRGRGESQ
jgi:RNA polymerase sigma-70 factor (ECF subfamily)